MDNIGYIPVVDTALHMQNCARSLLFILDVCSEPARSLLVMLGACSERARSLLIMLGVCSEFARSLLGVCSKPTRYPI